MVWVSVGVLAASASYLIYKYPPQSWRSITTCQGAKDGQQEDLRVGDSTEMARPEDLHTEDSFRSSVGNRCDSRRAGSVEAAHSPLTAPNTAYAQDTVPNFTIPSFNIASPPTKDPMSDPAISDLFLPQTQLSASNIPIPSESPIASSTGSATSLMMPPPGRLRAPPQPPKQDSSTSSMPPPPRPSSNTPLLPPLSAVSSLRVPPTKVLRNASVASSSSLAPDPSKKSRKVMLQPGHSPLDWAALTSNPEHKLRGLNRPEQLIRVPPSLLRHQNGRKGRDAWTVWQGKVYNITPYLPFHPGGEGELMRGAGKDAAKLFLEVHPWVNWEAMLGECLVGILVGEGDEKEVGRSLDAVD